MRLVLCGISAYEFWRSSLSIASPDFEGFLNTFQLTDFLHDTCTDVNKLLVNTGGSLNNKLHVLVQDQQDRRVAPNIISHSLPKGFDLPRGSIYQVSDEIAVVSPGLCFLQLTDCFDDLLLARAGCDLTSLYRRDFTLNRDLIQLNDCPFTKQDLLAYLDAAEGYRGQKRARRIANWVVERARSPREVSMDLLMAMPSKQGGYQLSDLAANVKIPLNDIDRRLSRREYLECDALLPNGDAMEYNSSTHHDTEEQLEFDFEKITALQHIGRTVIPVSTRQFNDFECFDTIMDTVSNRLDLRRKPAGEAILDLRRIQHARLLADERRQRLDENMIETAAWQLVLSRG